MGEVAGPVLPAVDETQLTVQLLWISETGERRCSVARTAGRKQDSLSGRQGGWGGGGKEQSAGLRPCVGREQANPLTGANPADNTSHLFRVPDKMAPPVPIIQQALQVPRAPHVQPD